jgi:hypothetical protein
MTKSGKQSWEQERAKGYSHFLLRSLLKTCLSFGILVPIAGILWPMFRHQPIAPAWQLLAEFGFCVVVYFTWRGVWRWRRQESDYQKPTEDDADRRSGVLPAAGTATMADVERLVRAGENIAAIRVYREIHHVGLAEAKKAIDDLQTAA